MNNTLKVLLTITLAFILLFSCAEKASTDKSLQEKSSPPGTLLDSNQIEQKPKQSLEDRILEIKDLYAKLQSYSSQEVDCKSASKTTHDGLSEEHKYPFENKAQDCQLQDNFRYKLVELNGYEWSESTTFYYKGEQLFFTFLRGGAEACAYEYRVYYAEDASVIRILLTENDCNAEDVPPSTEVRDAKKREQILKAVASAEEELNNILQMNTSHE
ncbi:MAG: hypothetical protein AAF696_24280 [Bacteroidota bacterium]